MPSQNWISPRLPSADTLSFPLLRPWNRICTTDRKSTTSELQSQSNLVCRLLLEKKKGYVGFVVAALDIQALEMAADRGCMCEAKIGASEAMLVGTVGSLQNVCVYGRVHVTTAD